LSLKVSFPRGVSIPAAATPARMIAPYLVRSWNHQRTIAMTAPTAMRRRH
jgi:hypothetical protein